MRMPKVLAKKSIKITTPKGEARYPFLVEPNRFQDDPIGYYKLDLIVVESEVNEMIEQIKKLTDEHFEVVTAELLDKAKNPGEKRKAEEAIKKITKQYPFEPEFDEESGEETGRIILKAKKKAAFNDKKTGNLIETSINIFDAAAKKVEDKSTLKGMGNGSICKMNVFLSPYYIPATGNLGVSLKLNSVQVIKFVEYGGAAPSGFEVEEEGFGVSGSSGSASSTDGADF
jgi:hypothetical protein